MSSAIRLEMMGEMMGNFSDETFLHLDQDVRITFNSRWGYSMTEQQLTERLQKLWVQATASCGSATPQLVEEIRELERMLKDLQEKQND